MLITSSPNILPFKKNTHVLPLRSIAYLASIYVATVAHTAMAADDIHLPTVEVQGQTARDANQDAAIDANFIALPKAPHYEATLNGYQSKTNITQQIHSMVPSQASTMAPRSAQDILQQDTSVQLNYAPVGYYENIQVRGLPLGFDSGYLQNGMPITHRHIPPLENKAQVQIIKGSDKDFGLQNMGGGAVQYLTKRPENIQTLSANWQTRQDMGLHADVGQKNAQWGYRANVAYNHLDSYVANTRGQRYLASLALDAQPNERWKIFTDIAMHGQKQYSVPGYQLLDGTDLPIIADLDPKKNLNNAAWRQPVRTQHAEIGVRSTYQFHPTWQAEIKAQYAQTRTDDSVAFPYGFAKNGDYTLYDYQSLGEERKNHYVEGKIRGEFNTGALTHQLQFNTSYYQFDTHQNDYINRKREQRNFYHPDDILATYPQSQNFKDGSNLQQIQKTVGLYDAMRYATPHGTYGAQLGVHWVDIEETQSSLPGSATPLNLKNHSRETLPFFGMSYHMDDQFLAYIRRQEHMELGALQQTLQGGNFLPAKKNTLLELGIHHKISPQTALNMAWFNVKRPYEYLNANWEYVQMGQEKRQGIEAQIWHDFTPKIGTELAATYIYKATQNGSDDSIRNGARAFNVPKLKMRAAVSYSFAPDWQTQWSINHEGKKAVDSAAHAWVPAYTTVDAAMSYAPMLAGHKVEYRFGVKNLLNKRYIKDSGLAFGEPYLHLGAPRTLFAQATLKF